MVGYRLVTVSTFKGVENLDLILMRLRGLVVANVELRNPLITDLVMAVNPLAILVAIPLAVSNGSELDRNPSDTVDRSVRRRHACGDPVRNRVENVGGLQVRGCLVIDGFYLASRDCVSSRPHRIHEEMAATGEAEQRTYQHG